MLYICVHVDAHVCARVNACARMCVFVLVCVVHMYLCLWVCGCACTRVRTWVCGWVWARVTSPCLLCLGVLSVASSSSPALTLTHSLASLHSRACVHECAARGTLSCTMHVCSLTVPTLQNNVWFHAQCTMHNAQCTYACSPSPPCKTMFGFMHNAQCTMHVRLLTVPTLQDNVWFHAQCTMHNAQCTMHVCSLTVHTLQDNVWVTQGASEASNRPAHTK